MPVPQPIANSGRHLLRDDAFIRIRAAIVDGTLAPGERLADTELAAWLGVSKTPVREALTRLDADGLVRTKPGRYTIVSPLDVRSIRHAQAVVASMHELAVREAVPAMTAEHIALMRAANDDFAHALMSEDVDAAIAADDRFHAVAVDAYANDVVSSVIDKYTPLLRRMERIRFGSLTGRSSVAQHLRIAYLAERHDAEGASKEARMNWLTLRPELIEADEPPA
ncbi:GntR family transcriptional regulator [Acrocarpospora catenulata]|uniref:GntR family transcriptional regulator n=1 Tax=Acrocarpospora catenulata TaxID=2836182 RepID=UPI001BD9E534|nr:GntR family transcriptional regulator [Acrocarpospora catenulata]